MKKILPVMLLLASPVWGQTQIAPKTPPKSTTARVADPCAPIGRTGKGELVYSMKCDSLPAPPPPAQAEAREAPAAAPAPESEVQRGGISAGPMIDGSKRPGRPVKTRPLNWSLLQLSPAAKDMAESLFPAIEKRDR